MAQDAPARPQSVYDNRHIGLRVPPRAKKASSRVIVDLTDVVSQVALGQALTGIPRVVLEFANETRIAAAQHEVEFLYGHYDQTAGYFCRLDLPPADPSGTPGGDLVSCLSSLVPRRRDRLINMQSIQAKYADRPLKRYLHTAKGQFRLLQRRLANRLGSRFSRGTPAAPMAFRPGDIVLMLGSGWYALPLLNYLTPFVANCTVKPVILVHDLIPLVETGEAPPVAPRIFVHWLRRASTLTRDFITYSASTRNDLLSHFDRANLPAPNVHLAPLTHELKVYDRTPLSPEISDLLDADFALFVGPCAGRKNAPRLFEAWRILLDRLGPDKTPLLVVTDATGADKVEQTHIRPIAGHVRLLRRPSDNELSALYRNAAFTIFPSLYEGWGLPVGESLWHGTPCVTSNISSLPEVGGKLCDYVDPYDVQSIADAAERLASDHAYREARAAAIRHHKFRRWSDFAEDVIHILTEKSSISPQKSASRDQAAALAG